MELLRKSRDWRNEEERDMAESMLRQEALSIK